MSSKDLSETFEIEVDGEQREVKMTYGLLDRLCRIVGDIDNAVQMTVLPGLREAALRAMLAKRDARGKVVEEVDPVEVEASRRDLLALAAWARGHVLDFFVEESKGVAGLLKEYAGDLEELAAAASSRTGSAA